MTGEPKVGKDWARDAEAFDAVYRENAPRLRAFLRQIVGSFQGAEDLTQEIFTQLWRQPDGFDPTRGSVRAYLFGIGKHQAAEWWRRRKPESSLPEDRSTVCDMERVSMISDVLQRLPEEQRTLLWLREVEGQSYAELALILDIPVGRFGRDCLWRGRRCGRSGLAQPKESCMRCDEAKEFVSAIYDGETVPPQAAEHMARCADCQELLKGYAEMGATLRSYGSLLIAEPVLDRTWLTTRKDKNMWLEKGLQMMRIPRIAFACLVLLLVVLGSRLAVVEVRAHADGSVLMLKLTPAQGNSLQCFVSTTDTDNNHCGGLAQMDRSNLFYSIKAVRKDGGRVLLSIRSRVAPLGPGGYGPDTESTLPETQSWFTPGQHLLIPDTGELKLALTGEWVDHMPVTFGSNQLLDPGPSEIRLTSPLLLKNNQVVGDMGNGSADADEPGDGAFLYIPGEGRFILSLTPVEGAIPTKVQLNRVSFESNGQRYIIVTGTPISRGGDIWVRHDVAYKPSPETIQVPMVGAGPVNKL